MVEDERRLAGAVQRGLKAEGFAVDLAFDGADGLHLAREGAYDHRSQRLDLSTGHVVAYRPPAPSGDHEWDSVGKRWQVKAAVRGAEGRTAVIYARIQALEATQGRAVREATLGDASAMKRLKEIDAEINDLRKELARS